MVADEAFAGQLPQISRWYSLEFALTEPNRKHKIRFRRRGVVIYSDYVTAGGYELVSSFLFRARFFFLGVVVGF